MCEDCNQVLMCECEKELVLTFLPHQTKFGTEYGSQKRYPVSGFATKICAECRGEKEEAHPKAAIYGRKGKIERYYWREIYKTYLSMVLDFIIQNNKHVKNIIEFERRFKATSKKMKRSASKIWQINHKENPKYDTTEITESKFLSQVPIPEIVVYAQYTQIQKGKQRVGKWISDSGEKTTIEEIATEHYRKLGFNVYRCERKLISSLVGTFCFPIIQDPGDPKNLIAMRQSTKGWTSTTKNTPLVFFSRPQDFGSHAYFNRRNQEFSKLFMELRKVDELRPIFDQLLEPSTSLRDYLWVNDDDSIELTRIALKVIPKEIIVDLIEWTIKHFWERQPGWPDLLIVKSDQYRFVEVKSPNDELSLDQMQWFRWAIEKEKIPCEICRVLKKGCKKMNK